MDDKIELEVYNYVPYGFENLANNPTSKLCQIINNYNISVEFRTVPIRGHVDEEAGQDLFSFIAAEAMGLKREDGNGRNLVLIGKDEEVLKKAKEELYQEYGADRV